APDVEYGTHVGRDEWLDFRAVEVAVATRVVHCDVPPGEDSSGRLLRSPPIALALARTYRRARWRRCRGCHTATLPTQLRTKLEAMTATTRDWSLRSPVARFHAT